MQMHYAKSLGHRIDDCKTAFALLVLQLQARSAGELPAGRDRSPDGLTDDIEGQLKNVMEDKDDAFSWAQPLEHHK
jgi:hypothetical protein